MDTFTTIVAVVCIIAYTVYAVWQLFNFKNRASTFIGGTLLCAGGVGVVLAAPYVAAFIITLLQLALGLALIAVIISALCGGS